MAELAERLAALDGEHTADAARLAAVASNLVRHGVWLIGGDGWAYDIGFGGLDHVLSSGRNVNILVLDTEVYSNTGGQASKATQRGAVAKFAAAGKSTGKKDLGAIARAYGNVYVAQISMGANELQTTKALLEADAWPGPSLVIAYSTCIAHGIDMSKSMTHQKDAVKSGYWPLYRFQPSEVDDGQPFKLDSKAPTIPVRDFVATETRYAILERTDPARARELSSLLQADIDERWRYYEQLAVDAPHRPARRPRRRGCRARRRERRRLPLRERGTGMTDLSTRYLGLDLRTPIVASASPLNGDLASPPSWSRTPVPRPSSCRRCSKRRSSTKRSSSTGRWKRARSTSPRRSTTSPTSAAFATRRRPIPRQDRSAQGPVVGADHRQPQRHQRRRLGPARVAASSRPAPTPSSSTCTTSPPTRPATPRTMEAADLEDHPVGARARCRSRWRSS